MKTAISIPDDTFKKAEETAGQLGITRSEFFTRAAVAYIRDAESASVTATVNAVLNRVSEDSDDAVEVSRRALRASKDEW